MIVEIGYAFGIGLVITFVIVLVFLSNGPWANRMASIRVRVDSSRRHYSNPNREEKKENFESYFLMLFIGILAILIFSRIIYGL
jgi:hypothetical protein